MTGSVPEVDPTPGYKRSLVYADEAGSTGQTFSGFGSLWMPWERRGDFQKILTTVREAHNHAGTLGAALTKNDLLLDLVDELFRRRWLAFRCVITPTSDDEELRRQALVELVLRRAKAHGTDVRLRLSRAARLPDGVGKKPQHSIHALLARDLPPGRDISVRAARTLDGIELVEILTGLVVSGWERKPMGKERHRLADRVAENLGWADLAADTGEAEWKLNIWYLADPRALSEDKKTARAVQLRLPMFD